MPMIIIKQVCDRENMIWTHDTKAFFIKKTVCVKFFFGLFFQKCVKSNLTKAKILDSAGIFHRKLQQNSASTIHSDEKIQQFSVHTVNSTNIMDKHCIPLFSWTRCINFHEFCGQASNSTIFMDTLQWFSLFSGKAYKQCSECPLFSWNSKKFSNNKNNNNNK